MLTSLVPVLFTFYIQVVLKLKKNNYGAKGLISSKIGQDKVNLISGIEFVSSVSNKFLPHTHTLVVPYCLRLRCHLRLLYLCMLLHKR